MPAVPVYIQEKIHPLAIVEDIRRRATAGQPANNLFADFNGLEDFQKKVEFYRHDRHWYWDRRRLAAAGDWAVSIHLLLNRDGSVAKAEIVDDPGHGGNPEYHDLALSARNAVLLSSPFNLPPGLYESVRDITLTLDPRTASQ